MSNTLITSPELAPPVGPFSQAVEVGGFIFLSGQAGQDPATGKVVEGGIDAETERVFRNVSAGLKARTTVTVAALPLGACVEIDMVIKA